MFIIFVFMIFLREIIASGVCRSDAFVTMNLTNNEYKGVVIAIEENMKEDLNFLQIIEDTFIKASEHLYTATKNRAFFKEITILVPKTWSEREYEAAGKELYENSPIRIKDTRIPGITGNTPYVKQFNNECGKPGLYMQLSTTFFTNGKILNFDLGKIIVHEFGHLRWGLYDEYASFIYPYGDPRDSFYYYDNNTKKWEVNRCTLAINVTVQAGVCNTSSLANCQPKGGQIDVVTNSDIRGSIMYIPNEEENFDSFCDDNSSNPFTYHNNLAPNRQNWLCNGKSAWAVMNESPDFNNSNPPRDVYNTTPTFRIVQQKVDRRVVFVLDVSGSMDKEVGTLNMNRLERMNQAASLYLSKAIDDCSYVGIVKFHSSAAVLQKLTKVENNRKILVNALQNFTEGSTCIGCGIQEALKVLKDGSNMTGGYIFVVSDGGENRDPRIANVTDEVIEAGVVVDALAFSRNAAESLETISNLTGGIFFSTSDQSSTQLFDSLLKTIECRPFYCENYARGITVESTSIVVNVNSNTTGFTYIDSTLGNNTAFIFTWETDIHIVVTLTSPNGTIFNSLYSGYEYNLENRFLSVNIAGSAEKGSWKYAIMNMDTENPQEVAIVVTSSQRSSDDPILVESFFTNADLDYENGDKQAIFAEVSKGDFPVLNATVEVWLEAPSGTITIIQLLDNGAGSDLNKYDGIYSTYVTAEITANGRYSVKIQVKNDGGAVIKEYVVGEKVQLPGDLIEKLNITEPEEIVTPADQFSRAGSLGAFTVNSYSPSIDPYPPSKIIDLEALDISVNNQTVTLTWTAVGSDLDTGSASSYDLRTSFSIDVLYNSFESAAKINQSDVLFGNLNTPLVAGSEERFTILLSNVNATYAIAVRAIDGNGNAGDVSNVVQAGIFIQKQIDDNSYIYNLVEITNTENLNDVNQNSEDETMAETFEPEDKTLTNLYSFVEETTLYFTTSKMPKDETLRNNHGKNKEMIIYLICSLIAGILLIGSVIYCAYKKNVHSKIRASNQDVTGLALQYTNTTANSGLWENGQFEQNLKENEETIGMFYNSFYSKNDLKGYYSHLDE